MAVLSQSKAVRVSAIARHGNNGGFRNVGLPAGNRRKQSGGNTPQSRSFQIDVLIPTCGLEPMRQTLPL